MQLRLDLTVEKFPRHLAPIPRRIMVGSLDKLSARHCYNNSVSRIFVKVSRQLGTGDLVFWIQCLDYYP
jgi:hypothetical protein